MTDDQKFVGAADMLVNARQAGGAPDEMPNDDLIRDFPTNLDQGCDTEMSAGFSMVDTATAVYLFDKAHWNG